MNHSPPNHPPQPPRNSSPQRPNQRPEPPPHPAKLLHQTSLELDRPPRLPAIPPNTHPDRRPPRPKQPHNPANANPPHHIPHGIHGLPNPNAPVNPPTPRRAPPVDPPPATTATDNLSNHLHIVLTHNPIASLLPPHQLESSLRAQHRRHGSGSGADRIAERGLDGHVQPALPLPRLQRCGRACLGLPRPTGRGDWSLDLHGRIGPAATAHGSLFAEPQSEFVGFEYRRFPRGGGCR